MNAVTNVKASFRFTLILALFLMFTVESVLFSGLGASRYVLAKSATRFAKCILFILGVQVGRIGRFSNRPGLLWCDPVSEIDLLVIAATLPSLFIAASHAQIAIAPWIFLQKIDFEEALHSGASVVLFSDTPGAPSLLEKAQITEVSPHSLCIRYSPSSRGIRSVAGASVFSRLYAICHHAPGLEANLISVGKMMSHSEPTYEIMQTAHVLRT
jgi:hypothetical protein